MYKKDKEGKINQITSYKIMPKLFDSSLFFIIRIKFAKVHNFHGTAKIIFSIVTTPFYSVLLSLLDEGNDSEKYNRSKAERKILIDCIQFVPKVAKKSVQEWITMKEKEDINITGPIDVKTYSKIHFDQMPKLDGFEKYSVSPILKLDAEYDSRNVEKWKDKLVGLANGDTVTSEINAQPYTPNFLRPIPECDSTLENFIVDDAFWLFPGVLPEPWWDYTLGNNWSRVKTLMKKSWNGQLIKSNTELIISTFKSDPEAVIHYGIHSNQFWKLVIQNKDLAFEFLNFMSPFPSIIEYYNTLAQTKVNLNSMELFSKLVEAHELPREYYWFYIHNLINSCTEEESKRTNESDSGSTK